MYNAYLWQIKRKHCSRANVRVKPVLSHVMTVDMRKKSAVGWGGALSLFIFTFTFTFPIFREAECTMMTPGHVITDVVSRNKCQQLCANGKSRLITESYRFKQLAGVGEGENWTYFTWSSGDQTCTCFASGERNCLVQAVMLGVSLEQVQSCKWKCFLANKYKK